MFPEHSLYVGELDVSVFAFLKGAKECPGLCLERLAFRMCQDMCELFFPFIPLSLFDRLFCSEESFLCRQKGSSPRRTMLGGGHVDPWFEYPNIHDDTYGEGEERGQEDHCV